MSNNDNFRPTYGDRYQQSFHQYANPQEGQKFTSNYNQVDNYQSFLTKERKNQEEYLHINKFN